ncbi:uncharacterized protein LOC128966356 [Oppia nitens]|uniref:uncharacterized protein LOC128966356 n=1 Tax=Oppia nitens TaxID=1686743 RepID=UPI0023DC9D82|nr:uncharacterized protein LOC128966356 [Oppia nitens]
MTTYTTSTDFNTNTTEVVVENESKDFGQEFLSQSVAVNSIVNNLTQSLPSKTGYCCVEQPIATIGQPFITCDGVLTMVLNKDIRVDINASHAICVTTPNSKVAVSYSGQNIGVIHPFGRVYQELIPFNSCHIESGIHLAKIGSRGVTFTSLYRSLIYLVDTSGCKTTTERFRKLNYDFTNEIFNMNGLNGDYARHKAFSDLLRGGYEMSKDGSDQFWFLAGLRIRQNSISGDLMLTKSYGKTVIHISPEMNSIKVSAPNLRIAATPKSEAYLQIIKPHSRDEQRVSAGYDYFRVKYGSQKAGFDGRDQLVLI